MRILVASLLCCVLSACSAKLVVVDRQTIIEQESAAQWPDFEKQVQKKLEKRGPSFFAKEKDSKKKQKLLNLLNSEFVNKDKKLVR